MKETTTGTGTRGPHALKDALMTFELAREVERLRTEPEWRERDRTSITLVKTPSFRLVLTVLRAGAELGDDDAKGPLAVHVLEGSALVGRDHAAVTVGAGSVATIEPGGRWAVRADGDAALLLAIAWPEERAVV